MEGSVEQIEDNVSTLAELAARGGRMLVPQDVPLPAGVKKAEVDGLVRIRDGGTWGVYDTVELTTEGRVAAGLPLREGKPSLFFRQLRQALRL